MYVYIYIYIYTYDHTISSHVGALPGGLRRERAGRQRQHAAALGRRGRERGGGSGIDSKV